MWEEIVGPATAKVSTAVACKDGILFVEVKNSVWAAELSLLKKDIIWKINHRLGRGTVKDIRFRATGKSFGTHKSKYCKEKTENTFAVQKQALPKSEITRLKELALDIDDPKLQEAFVRFAIAAKETSALRDSTSRG